MSGMTPKERLRRVLCRERVDRPPTICTGGMMNAAIVDVMRASGHTLPEASFEATAMAALAEEVSRATGFENLGVPFCMTVEAEALGSRVDAGTLECEARVCAEAFASVEAVARRDVEPMVRGGRIAIVLEAVQLLAARRREMPVIVSLTGPVSTAASIVEPMTFLRELRRRPEAAHGVLDYVTELLVAYAREAAAAGADVIAVGDPTATGEILGPALFEEFALPSLNRLADAVHALGKPVIIHICGDMRASRHLLPRLHGDAISTDSRVNLAALKRDFPQLTTMGNVSTALLQLATPERVARVARRLVEIGVDIISPACGLSTATGLANVRALTDAVIAHST